MRSVRYHPDARAEFLHEVEYCSRLSARLSERFDKAVLTAEARAAEDPELWPKYKHKTRRVVDRKFKFSLVYQGLVSVEDLWCKAQDYTT